MSCNVEEVTNKILEEVAKKLKTSTSNVEAKVIDTEQLTKYIRIQLQDHNNSTLPHRVTELLDRMPSVVPEATTSSKSNSSAKKSKSKATKKKAKPLIKEDRNKLVHKADSIGLPSKHIEKEKSKIAIATQVIAKGKAGSTTDKIEKLYPTTARNTGDYSSNDIVYISVNGNRKDRVIPFTRKGKYHKGPVNKTKGDETYVKNLTNAVKNKASIVVDSDKHLHLDNKDKSSFSYGTYNVKKYKKDGKQVTTKGEYNRGEWDIDEWMSTYADGYVKHNVVVNGQEIGVWVYAPTNGTFEDVYKNLLDNDVIIKDKNEKVESIEKALKDLLPYIPKTFLKAEYATYREGLYQLLKAVYGGKPTLGSYYDGKASVIDFSSHINKYSKMPNNSLKNYIDRALKEKKSIIEKLLKEHSEDKEYVDTLNKELTLVNKMIKDMNSGDINFDELGKGLDAEAKKWASNEKFNATLLHEVTHGLIDDWLSRASEEELAPLKALYQEALEKHPSKDTNAYWRQDLHEFVAEMLSNRELIKELNKIKSKNNVGLGTRFIGLIKNILNTIFKNANIEITEDSISGQVMIQLDKVMQNTNKADEVTAKDLIDDITKMVKDC